MNKRESELLAAISRISCVNGHSHLPPETERLTEPVDVLALFKHAYLNADLVAAGMTSEAREKVFSAALPLDERWRHLAPFWKSIRLTGYSQCATEAFRDLFGFPELSAATIGPLSDALLARARPGFYAE